MPPVTPALPRPKPDPKIGNFTQIVKYWSRLQLDEAAREKPSHPEPYITLGNIALHEGRIAEATMDFDKAKQLLEKYTNTERKGAMEQQALSGIAVTAEACQDWSKAETCLRDLLKLAPEDLPVHERLAHSLFLQGKAKDAYEILTAAEKIDRETARKNGTQEVLLIPEAVIAQYYYYENTDFNRHQADEKWFMAALKKAPNDLPTRQAVAIWALGNGKIQVFKEQADQALRIEADDAKRKPADRKYSGSTVGHSLRGLVALWEKDWATAELHFQKAVDDSPNDFVARNNIALALVEQDDPAKKRRALAYAWANYREEKNSADTLWTLGWVYFRRNQFDLAKLALERAANITSDNVSNADTATYLAHVRYRQGEKWKAKDILEHILKGDRPFCMRPEAKQLYEKVKDAEKLDAVPTAKRP